MFPPSKPGVAPLAAIKSLLGRGKKSGGSLAKAIARKRKVKKPGKPRKPKMMLPEDAEY